MPHCLPRKLALHHVVEGARKHVAMDEDAWTETCTPDLALRRVVEGACKHVAMDDDAWTEGITEGPGPKGYRKGLDRRDNGRGLGRRD